MVSQERAHALKEDKTCSACGTRLIPFNDMWYHPASTACPKGYHRLMTIDVDVVEPTVYAQFEHEYGVPDITLEDYINALHDRIDTLEHTDSFWTRLRYWFSRRQRPQQ